MLTDMNPAELSIETFRDAMAQLGAAVHVITTDGPGGRAGFTASAVCSVTDTPPSVLVCINRSSSAYPTVTENGQVCINTLSADQHDISSGFSKKGTMDDRFAHGTWIEREARPPRLADASASIDCKIVSRTQVGTHDILICEVSEITSNAHPGVLIYYDRKYHRILRG
jgi:flavin reductase